MSKERCQHIHKNKHPVSSSIKEEIRKEQDYHCADCGIETKRLEIHHIEPRCQGGSNNRVNLIALCGEWDNDCHEKWDRLALDQHIYCDLPQVRKVLK